MKNKIIIYLDSSDYSTLSAPLLGKEYSSCLNSLKNFSKKNNVKFVFSASVVSEMMPLKVEHLPYSKSRLKLMNELCSGSLIDMSSLIKTELIALNSKKAKPIDVLSPKHSWIPGFKSIKRPAFKLKNGLDKRSFEIQVKEFSLKHKIPLEISFFANAVSVGAITEDAAAEYMAYEMRDIDRLIQFMEFQFELSRTISSLVRGPSIAFHNEFSKIIDDFKGGTLMVNKDFFNNDEILLKIIDRFYNSIFNLSSLAVVDDMKKFCPGISTAVLSSYISLRNSFSESNSRNLKSSDLVDSFHGIYTPYVDIFRADKYMSKYIKAACPSENVNVVDNLLDIPDVINSLLFKK